jgi:glycolate dehydrogenase FAD-binding subunit
MASDPVLDGLRKLCEDRATPAGNADSVSGVLPRYVASPGSTQQTADVLRLAAEHDLTVVPRGGGTTLHWGAPPRAVDVVLDTTRLTGVVDHAAGDLVAVVRAGTPLAVVQQELSSADQQLALDSPDPRATVGGAVAANVSGPRRLLYGTVRDLLIGVTFVRADGVVARAGGRVVKNVAGYDFGKLLAGSFGTLGVLTRATFRLHPLPAARRTVTVQADGAAATRIAAAVLGSQLAASAVEVDQPAQGPLEVAVLLEGVEAGVSGRSAAAVELTGGAQGPEPAWFGRDPFTADEVALKLSCTITRVGPLLAAARRAVDELGVALSVRGSAMGVLYAGLPAGTEPATVAGVLARLRAVAAPEGGSVVLLAAPAAVREAVDAWGPVPGLDLMRRLKRELDPSDRLSPGRFVGGI